MMLRHNDSGSQSVLRASTESSKLWFIFGKTHRATMEVSDTLPDDIDALRALLLAERASRAAVVAERDKLVVRNERLEAIISEIRRAYFGRKSERITDDQLSLALEELETSLATAEAEEEKSDPALKAAATSKRRASRDENLDHLPHEEMVIEPESKACPCCGGELHVIGEDTSKRLDKVPAKVRVIVTRRPKYACRSCEKTGADTVAGVIQAAAPARLIEGGLPTEAMVADVVVSKHADHLPLYRQSQILARSGVKIERSTLAQWVGAAAAELQPLHDHLIDLLKASPRLFCDETRCPVLDPGAGKTKTGYLWALARDDRPWGGGMDAAGPAEHRGSGPPAVAYSYAPGRGGEHAAKLLHGFNGILQVDGYAAYKKLGRQRADRNRSARAHQAALRHRGGGPRLAARHTPRRAAAAVKTRRRSLEALVRGQSCEDVEGQQARRSACLWPQPLGRLVPLPRRRPHRDRQQHRRAFDPRFGPDKEKRTVRWPRSRRGRMGHDRVAS